MRRIYFLLAIIWFPFSGCEEQLTMTPETSLTFLNALNTPQDFESMLNKADQSLQNASYVNQYDYNQCVKGLFADEMETWTMEWRLMNLSPDGLPGMMSWRDYYDMIWVVNSIIRFTGEGALSEERAEFYSGEAYFYKALAYFQLIRNWGDCILVKDEVEPLAMEKSPWQEVADYAIDMAQAAVDRLPQWDKVRDWRGSAPQYKNTPCRESASALLAHLCAWKAGCKYFAKDQNYDEQKLWLRAEQACTEVIQSDNFSLVSSPEEVCTSVVVGDSRESLYETVFRNYFYELGMNGEYIDYNLARMNYITWPVAPNQQPADVTDGMARIYASTVKEMYGEEDLRRSAYFYKVDEMSSGEMATVSRGYAYPYKYRDVRLSTDDWSAGDVTGLDCNKIWFRLADIILLRAECRARLGGEYIADAIEDLNTIRDRAEANRYEASEHDGDLRYTIYKEREKETLMEEFRYFDIIRNGYVRTELRGGYQTVTDQDLKDGALFLPIGSGAFVKNPLLRQNAYWFKFM